jgi:hypothetical protein
MMPKQSSNESMIQRSPKKKVVSYVEDAQQFVTTNKNY